MAVVKEASQEDAHARGRWAGARPAAVVRREGRTVRRAARAAWRGPGRERDMVVQSLKAAAAALLAWLVARDWLGDPMALMAPWVALVLVQATVYSSLRRSVQQFTAICAGTLCASAAQALTHDTTASLALCVPVLMLLANWPRFGDQGVYGATTAVFTLATGSVSTAAVGHRLGQTALGAVIGVAVNALVLPPIHLRDVRENLAALAREAGEVLHEVAADLNREDWDPGAAAGWSHGSDRLERRLTSLHAARAWSRESLRLTNGVLRRLRRVPGPVPPEEEDERWARVTGHIRSLTRTLAVATDDNRAPAPPDTPVLRTYARLLDLIADRCRTEAGRLLHGGVAQPPDGEARAAMEELHGHVQEALREHAGREATRTTVLGSLLLQAENVWAEVVPGAVQEAGQRAE
ncbi:FUSC family protein [Streptomyces naganishii]|uniref:FUSC family protein n=1 Tax=Streptomyces naganishii JCM 4654 TaxID=1306179 RepID=A0A919CUW5_9ACTN|nr:FUSC family protein [Streptomyces naganishii JCM 4654]